MIDLTLKFLAEEVNYYLKSQPDEASVSTDRKLILGNASRIFDTDTSNVEEQMADRAILSLVHLEEDRMSRKTELLTKNTGTALTYQQPPVLLNIYVLFVMNLKMQDVALRWLSAVIRFFQHQPVFTPLTHTALDTRIEKLTVDMHTLNFEQANQLWSMLGGKYLPSVLYKIRQLTVDENAVQSGGGFIRDISILEKGKQPLS